MILIEHIQAILTFVDTQHSYDPILYGKTRGKKNDTTIIILCKLTNGNKLFLNARNN